MVSFIYRKAINHHICGCRQRKISGGSLSLAQATTSLYLLMPRFILESLQVCLKDICYICYEGSDTERLISPCSCKGGTRFVHHHCLKRFVIQVKFFQSKLIVCGENK